MGLVAMALAGCSGDDGSQGPPGTPGLPLPSAATALNITVTGVTIASPPVVNFKVTNQDGTPVAGLTTNDVRFTLAKLVPGANGNPSAWQSYINTVATAAAGTPGAGTTAIQSTREGGTTGAFVGTFVDNKDGSYSYTFKTDIANVTTPLAVAYEPTLTHRLGIQTRGTLPEANVVYDFRPSDGATTGLFSREIVKTGKCNECHDRIVAHDARIETRYCVTCHNPGSKDPDSGNTVDFKVMIHKIHRGENLPTVGGCNRPGCVVTGGGDYSIIGFGGTVHSFGTIVLPQDIRNCVKCHDGADTATPQGANWNTAPSMEACGSCHEQTKFDEAPGTTPNSHPGGIVTNAQCLTCHVDTNVAGSPAKSHTLFTKVAAQKFRFEVLSICATAVGSNPVCAPGTAAPVVTFQVVDPTGGTHAFGDKYDVRSTGTDPEFTNAASSLNVLMAWDTRDYNNAGGSVPAGPYTSIPSRLPARAESVNARTGATSLGNGVFQVTMPPVPAGASGSGTIAVEGHPAGVGPSGTFTDAVRALVKAQVAHFGITDTVPKARRQVVDITTKCDRCHDLLSVHGNNRSDEEALCIMCHNPSNTDGRVRPRDGAGMLTGLTLDGLKENSVDFKRMIHGIHAAAKSNFDGTIAHGFRESGYVVWSGSGPHDYSHVRFPGVLSKCTTCHLNGTYTLADRSAAGGANWELPSQNGILGSTIETAPGHTSWDTAVAGMINQANQNNISPTAAVCSACHDGLVARTHMELNNASFSATQALISATVETCAACHGPGKIASVEFVHSADFGADIP
jgi:OmcA/MtrC family decaheme c-type cytochrome